eukprot:CAMPEP_0115289912 /NCGR_PEP_ID=MMETSP0270-20121206/63761_1 /TAXON_ID=71861 /ORGANISM="Scrippsiella trochoidea, Strain CCMP3099" /LENGTH=108 /DNA_ID=CAMNT_0002707121 /DNA_START=123 /DNA_END=449 /DNA_ORIENTATION=-
MASTQNTSSGRPSFGAMVHCLFAMLFAALVLGMLYSTGFKTRGNYCASSAEGAYGWCQVAQDLRSLTATNTSSHTDASCEFVLDLSSLCQASAPMREASASESQTAED